MFKNIDFKKIGIELIPVVIFLAITFTYFSPMLEGKRIKQQDGDQWRGMSKEILDYRAKTGKDSFWTNSMFGGMPTYQITAKYTGNIAPAIDKVLRLGIPMPFGILFISMLGFFFLLRVLKVNRWIAVAGAIAYALSSYFLIIIEVGHNSKAHALAYMAPLIASLILLYRGKYILGGVLTALFLALELNTNHLQITYYLMIVVVLFLISEFVQSIVKKGIPIFFKSSAIGLIAMFIAVGINIPNLWITYEYSKQTIRGKTELSSEKENRTSGLDKKYAVDWSYGIGESMTLLIPYARGGATYSSVPESSHTYKAFIQQNIPPAQAKTYIKQVPTYWGPQSGTAGPTYAGAIMIFLFILALMVADKKYKWWLIAATILSLLLAWGKNFMPFTNFFLEYVPGYNKFRAVSMTLIIAEFTIPLLGILGLQALIDSKMQLKDKLQRLYIAGGITAGITLIFALFSKSLFNFDSLMDGQIQSAYPEWYFNAVKSDRAYLLQRDAWRSFAFIVLSAGAIWLYLKGILKKAYFLPLLIVLVLIDMWAVDRRYLNDEHFTAKHNTLNPFTPSTADEIILKDVDPNFRVFNQTVSPFNDASTSYFHKSIGGYHGAKLRRYQEVIDHCLSKGNMGVYNMLNTKYVIVPNQQNGNEPMAQINMQALGNAWFVNSFKIVNNADEEILALDSLNPASQAIVDKRFAEQLKGLEIKTDSAGFIKLTKYEPNNLEYSYKAGSQQLAVFSEIYYPDGWQAYVDGKPAPHFRVNYILRAMVVSAGEHTIVFKFEPSIVTKTETISKASSAILILAMIGLIVLSYLNSRKKNKNGEVAEELK